MEGPHFEEFYPDRPVDASHPELLLDFNRCILCELCVRASRDVDGKNVFAIGGHGIGTRLVVNSPSGRLADSDIHADDRGRTHLPGGRDPAQAARLRGARSASGRFDQCMLSPTRGRANDDAARRSPCMGRAS
jgi:ferredoxin